MTTILANNFTEFRRFRESIGEPRNLLRFKHKDEDLRGVLGTIVVLNDAISNSKSNKEIYDYLEPKIMKGQVNLKFRKI